MIIFKHRPILNRSENIKRIVQDHMKAPSDFYTELYNRNQHHMIFAGARENHTFRNINGIYGVMIERRSCPKRHSWTLPP